MPLTFAGGPSTAKALPGAQAAGAGARRALRPVPADGSLPDPERQTELERLEARLRAAQAANQPKARAAAASAFARGTRYAMEIAVATMVGAGIGWALDRWLGTRPWLFLLLLLAGVAAGFRNLMRGVAAEAEAARRRAGETAGGAADEAGASGGTGGPAPSGPAPHGEVRGQER